MTTEASISDTRDNIAFAYLRVSTEDQGEKGLSIEHQNEMAIKYVEEYNKKLDTNDSPKIVLDPKNIYTEIKPASTIFSNSIDNDLKENLRSRPELLKIIEAAQNKKFGHLILLSRDRLTRDFQQFIALKYLLSKNGIKIHYTRPGENLEIEDKKISRFIDNILASVAELEANVISLRVKGGSRLCVKNGYWSGGRPPLGYISKGIKKEGRTRKLSILVPSYYERNQIQKVFEYYNFGYGYRKIAEFMNKQYESSIWTKSKVEAIIKNETYTGRIAWDRRGGRRHPGKHDEIEYSSFNEDLCFISKENWDTVTKLRAYKTEVKDPKYYDTPYLLKNKLVCGKCGNKLESRNYGRNKNGENICIYRCPTKSEGKYELVLNKDEIEVLVLKELSALMSSSSNFDNNIDKMWDIYTKERQRHNTILTEELTDLDEKIKEVEMLRTNIQHMLSDIEDKDLGQKILHQDTLLSKLKIRYEKEKSIKISKMKDKFIEDKSEYKKILHRFLVNLQDLDTRSKRMFIDLIVSKIIINDFNGQSSIKIIINPAPIIR